jgi:hypothetical protein
MAPNQQPTRFDMATERPSAVVLGGGGKVGKSEADKDVTARILLSVVSGN